MPDALPPPNSIRHLFLASAVRRGPGGALRVAVAFCRRAPRPSRLSAVPARDATERRPRHFAAAAACRELTPWRRPRCASLAHRQTSGFSTCPLARLQLPHQACRDRCPAAGPLRSGCRQPAPARAGCALHSTSRRATGAVRSACRPGCGAPESVGQVARQDGHRRRPPAAPRRARRCATRGRCPASQGQEPLECGRGRARTEPCALFQFPGRSA